MAAPDQVIVEFIADTSQLTPATEQLQQFGEIDSGTAVIFNKTNQALKERNAILASNLAKNEQLTASVSGQQESYNKLVASVKNLSGESKNAVQAMLRFATGDIARSFKATGVSVDEYTKLITKAGTESTVLTKTQSNITTQLNQVKNALAALGPQTAENAAQFRALAFQGGKLQEELNQTRGVIRSLGSESPVLSAFTNVVGGLAGGFQAAVGAAALFGDENKDLQATLVKVTSVTAIAQGVQQALNVVNKSGALTTLELAVATKFANTQKQIDIALTSESTVARIAATAAQYALNLAMSLNPIGIVVIALSAFIAGLIIFTGKAKEAAEAQGQLNAAIAATDEGLTAQLDGLKQSNEEYLNELDNRNAKQSEKERAQSQNLVRIIQARSEQIQKNESTVQTARLSRDKDVLKSADELEKKTFALKQQNSEDLHKLDQKNADGRNTIENESLAAANANANARLALATKNSAEFFAAQRVAIATQAAIDLKAAGDNKEKENEIKAKADRAYRDNKQAEDAEAERVRQARLVSGLEKIQIESRRINSNIAADETAQQIKIIEDRMAFEVKAEGLRQSEVLAIQRKGQLEIEALRRDQLKRDIELANTNAIALNKVELDSVKLTDAERVNLEIETSRDETAIQLAAVNLTEQQRLAIIADGAARERKIRLDAIDQQANDAIRAAAALNDNANSELQRQLDAQDQIRNASTISGGPKATAAALGVPILNLDQQKDAIDKITQFQIDQNGILIQSNADKYAQQLISEKEFYANGADLNAKAVQIHKEGEEKKRMAIKATADFQKQMTLAIVNTALSGVAQGLQILQSLYQQQDQAANDRLAAQKQRIADELEAGVITAKAAAVRNKQIDAQLKAQQREQAKRNKEMAIFQAIIGTAQAVIAALAAPPPLSFISAAIAAALGAAQIAVIASQPLPRFGKGKKDSYQGLGEIGETGPEILESGGQKYLAKQPSIVWLGAKDKVYTPRETSTMIMNNSIPALNVVNNQKDFDYDKLGRAVAENIPGVSLNIDGYKEFIKSKHSFEERLNSRRKWQ